MSAIPKILNAPAGDFRSGLMSDVPDENDKRTKPAVPEGNFIERLAPQAADVALPTGDQTSTTAIGADAVDGAKAALEALRWPIEKYAEVCARIELAPHKQQLVWAEYGIVGKNMLRVLSRWRKRFQKDPALEAQWRSLIDAKLQADAHDMDGDG